MWIVIGTLTPPVLLIVISYILLLYGFKKVDKKNRVLKILEIICITIIPILSYFFLVWWWGFAWWQKFMLVYAVVLPCLGLVVAISGFKKTKRKESFLRVIAIIVSIISVPSLLMFSIISGDVTGQHHVHNRRAILATVNNEDHPLFYRYMRLFTGHYSRDRRISSNEFQRLLESLGRA